jgi:hypothetical protein
MNRKRVGIILGLVVAAGGAAHLAIRWAAHPDGVLLLPQGGAQWIRMDEPPSVHHRTVETRRIHFVRRFSLGAPPEEARLRVRAFRSAVVHLNGRKIDSESDEFDVAASLHRGLNDLKVSVANDRGPPALLVSSEDLDVSTPREWWVTAADSGWSRARPVSERTPFAASREFPSVWRILAGKLHFLVAFFVIGALGSLVLAKYAVAHRVRWALLGAWIVLCANNFWKIPIHIGFDVMGHYDYIAFILDKGRLPLATDGWVMFQPPLFYLLAAFPAALAAGRMEPENAVLLLRALPMLCGLAQVEIAFRSSRIAFPRRNDLQIIGTVVGGFLPMNLYISQTVGNEPLSGCLTALLVYCACKLLVEPSQGSLQKACGGLGLLFGLALLAKISVIVLLPAILLSILYVGRSRGSRPVQVVLSSATFFLVGILVAGWYFVRNWIHYGKPLLLHTGDSVSKFAWWQDPGYRIPEDLFSFGEALTFPVFSSLMGFWDGLYSTVWLDGLRNVVKARGASPQWNHEFMLCVALLSIPMTIAGIVGALRALRKPSSGSGRVGLFSVACLGSFLAAMLFMFVTVPAYSAVKSSYALGLLPCFAVLMASGIGLIPRSAPSRAVVSGYVFSWLAFTYIAYFAW